MDRIFVQIASYRDPECPWTVKDLFEKAKQPGRVFAGICNQVDLEKDKAFFGHGYPFGSQVREIVVPAMESRGVCWARHEAQKLYRGEEYVLMIDSHMRFVQNWDELLIEELGLCPSEKAVCTVYPAAYTPPDILDVTEQAIVMVAKPFDRLGDLRLASRVLNTATPRPLRGAFVAACFLFARGGIVTDVPYDPHMYFGQEEISLSARLFTHGWDVFSPRTNLLYHFYLLGKLKNRRLHWEDNRDWLRMARLGRRRFEALVAGGCDDDTGEHLVDLDRYRLGQVRTLKAFEDFVGIDFVARQTSEKALRGTFIEGIEAYT